MSKMKEYFLEQIEKDVRNQIYQEIKVQHELSKAGEIRDTNSRMIDCLSGDCQHLEDMEIAIGKKSKDETSLD